MNRMILRDAMWTAAMFFLTALLMCAAPRPGRGEDVRLLDFYSEWCGPCQAMAPVVAALAADGYAVERIDVDRRPELAARYGIARIPTFVVVARDQEIDRVVGPTTVERLKLKLRCKASSPASLAPLGAPRAAWRYERPEGHRAAVVRIHCENADQSRCTGSGTLVRWGGRVVALTARHVVKDAARIVIELHNGVRHRARTIELDADWDCAVLEITDGPAAGMETAEVELGPAAVQTAGARLESCGYGADGRLACNSGLFIGYRRSERRPNGPDDWMLISGRARSGDSGGPVFNRRGRLVGVLWGANQDEVVGVQAGRVHAILDAAAARQTTTAAERAEIARRSPTPPKPADDDRRYTLPYRERQAERDAAIEAQLGRIEGLLDDMQAGRPGGCCPSPPAAAPAPNPSPSPASVKNQAKASPAIAAMCIAASIGLASAMYFLTAKES